MFAEFSQTSISSGSSTGGGGAGGLMMKEPAGGGAGAPVEGAMGGAGQEEQYSTTWHSSLHRGRAGWQTVVGLLAQRVLYVTHRHSLTSRQHSTGSDWDSSFFSSSSSSSSAGWDDRGGGENSRTNFSIFPQKSLAILLLGDLLALEVPWQ